MSTGRFKATLDPMTSGATSTPTFSTGQVVSFVCAVIVGVVLRFYGLSHQILIGDELHALLAVSRLSLSETLVTFASNDFSPPLAGFYHLWSSWMPLDEQALRAPIELAGALVLVIVPLTLRRYLDSTATIVLAWMLALSPTLISYSRIARPYMPVVLASFLAVSTFYFWMHRPRWWIAWAYVAGASLSIYLHPITTPFVLAPFVYLLGVSLTRRRTTLPSRAAVAGIALLTAAAIALFLFPARESLIQLVSVKRGQGTIQAAIWLDVAALQAGTAWRPLAVTFVLATVAGWVILVRRETQWAAYVLTLLVVQAFGLAVLSPARFGEPLILNRYLLITLPFTLAAVAVTLAGQWIPSAVPYRKGLRRTLAVGGLVLLVISGPIPDDRYWRSSFLNHNHFVDVFQPLATKPHIPTVYDELARTDEPRVVIEGPCDPRWDHTVSYYVNQNHHGHPVRLTCPGPAGAIDRSRFTLRSYLPSDLSVLLASDADLLIVHTHLPAEERSTTRPAWSSRQSRRALRQAARQLAEQAQKAWGPPDRTENRLLVWDLARVRRQEEHRPASPRGRFRTSASQG